MQAEREHHAGLSPEDAPFGSKQELQLATVEEAGRILAEEVVRPATGMAPTVIFREVGIEP